MTHKPILAFMVLVCITFLSERLVLAQDNHTLPIISTNNAAQLKPIDAISSSRIGDIVWSPDGAWLAVGTTPYGVKVFSADDLTSSPLQFAGSTDILFHAGSKYIVSGGAVWDLDTQQINFSFGEVTFRSFSPDGRYLVTATRRDDRTDFIFYEMPSGEVLHRFSVDAVQKFQNIVFSADLSRFALIFHTPHLSFTTAYSEYQDNSFVQVRDTSSAAILSIFDADYPELEVIFSNQGQYLVAINTENSYGALPSKVIIWDIEQEKRIHEFNTYDSPTTFSPYNKWIFVSDFSTPYLIELDSGRTIILEVNQRIEIGYWTTPEFSSDGSYMAIPYSETTGGDSTEYGVLLWDMHALNQGLDSATRFASDISQNTGPVNDFQFSPDNQLLAVSFGSQTVVWDVKSQTVQLSIQETGTVNFTSDSAYLLVGTYSVYEIETGTLINESVIASNGLFRPNRRQLITRSPDTICVFDLFTSEETCLSILDDYLGRVSHINNKTNQVVFSDTTLSVIDLLSQERLLQIDSAPDQYTMSLDGSLLIVWSRSQTQQGDSTPLIVYDLQDGNKTPMMLEETENLRGLLSAAISPDSERILVIEFDIDAQISRLGLYDADTGALLVNWQYEQDRLWTAATFSPDSDYVIVMTSTQPELGYREFLIRVWALDELFNGNLQPQITLPIALQFLYEFDVEFSPDGSQLFVSLDDATLGDGPPIHDYHLVVLDWTELLALNGQLSLNDLNIQVLDTAYNPIVNPNKPLLTSGTVWSRDLARHISFVYLWESETGELLVSLEGFSKGIYSPDGNLLAALSEDRHMMIWNVETLLQGDQTPLVTLDSRDVVGIAFSAAGDRLYQQTTYGVTTLGVNP